MLKDYFYYREIFDDDKMDRVFTRTIDIVRDRYKQLLRVESIEFDPLVSKYFEAEYVTRADSDGNIRTDLTGTLARRLGETVTTDDAINFTGRTDGEGTSSEDFNGTKSERIEDDGSMSRQGSGTNSSHSSTTGQNNLTSNTVDANTSNVKGNDSSTKHTDTIGRTANKAAPMNASGVTIGEETGKLGGLDFSYASAFAQNDGTGDEVTSGNNASTTQNNGNSTTTDTGNSNSTTNANGSNSNSESGTNSNLRTGSYGDDNHTQNANAYLELNDENTAEHKTVVKSGTNTDETTEVTNKVNHGTENTVKRDRYTGRDGVLPQEAMASATHYLMNYSTAFQWLCNKLEPCFIGVYDI